VNRNQIFVTLASIALLLGLYFVGTRNLPPDQQNAGAMPGANRDGAAPIQPTTPVIDMPQLVQTLKNKVSTDSKERITALEEQLKTADKTQQAKLYNQLANEWEKARYVEITAYFSQKVAQTDSTKENWQKAADKIAIASAISNDSTLRGYLLSSMVSAYEHVQAFEPKNLETQVKLATAYIEGAGPDPSQVMKGVMMLREVVHKDTTNVNANLVLGRMAVVSNQLDKAIPRLQYVIQLDPSNIDAYYYLGEAYAKKGDKDNAIKTLKKCKSLTKSTTFAREIDDIINNL